MTMDREAILQVMARRAGFTETQVEALRRRDYAALLLEEPPSRADPPSVPGERGPADPLGDADPPAAAWPAGGAGPLGAGAPSVADLQVALERVSRRLATVRGQRDAALQLLRRLATRLGCCPDCWGTEAACPTCGGLGSPGYFEPDAHLVDWLGPALGPAGAAPPDRSAPPPTAPPGDTDPAAPGDVHASTPPTAAAVRRQATTHTDGWA